MMQVEQMIVSLQSWVPCLSTLSASHRIAVAPVRIDTLCMCRVEVMNQRISPR